MWALWKFSISARPLRHFKYKKTQIFQLYIRQFCSQLPFTNFGVFLNAFLYVLSFSIACSGLHHQHAIKHDHVMSDRLGRKWSIWKAKATMLHLLAVDLSSQEVSSPTKLSCSLLIEKRGTRNMVYSRRTFFTLFKISDKFVHQNKWRYHAILEYSTGE